MGSEERDDIDKTIDAFGDIDPKYIVESDEYVEKAIAKSKRRKNNIIILTKCMAAIIPIVLVITIGVVVIRRSSLHQTPTEIKDNVTEDSYSNEMNNIVNDVDKEESLEEDVFDNSNNCEETTRQKEIILFEAYSNYAEGYVLTGYCIDNFGNKFLFDFSDMEEMTSEYQIYDNLKKYIVSCDDYIKEYQKKDINKLQELIKNVDIDLKYESEQHAFDMGQRSIYVVKRCENNGKLTEEIVLISSEGDTNRLPLTETANEIRDIVLAH